MKKILLKLIYFYKRFISNGYNCRMIPNCSDYTYEAVEKYGAAKGLMMGAKRILKCHPWGKSGIDLVK